jgi:hypothetical protein
MQMKTIPRFHLSFVRMATMQKTNKSWQGRRTKKEPFYTAGGNVNWCSYYGKIYRVPQKFRTRTSI